MKAQKLLRFIEIGILLSSFVLIVFGIITAIQVRDAELEHRRVAEEILTDMKNILQGRAACVIPLEEVLPND